LAGGTAKHFRLAAQRGLQEHHMFITLEGIEGAGKTTQLEKIVAFLESRGYECLVTREPGGTSIGDRIRAILLDPDHVGLDPVAELLLYVADRVQHIRTVIAPNTAAGRVVICDRFFDATMVYQGYARGVNKQMISRLHRLVCDNLQPDLTLLFDVDPQTGLKRAWREIQKGSRADTETRFEQERLSFHQKVRAGYLELARLAPGRIRVIDAGLPAEEVTEAARKALVPILAGRP
jgi:dTMP kinase